MIKLFKRIIQLTFALGILILLVFVVQINSDKFSTHRASLQCKWTESSTNARDWIDWPDDMVNTFQIREDWINNTLTSYSIASGVEGGINEARIYEDPKKYWRVEYGDTFKATTTYNRETLMHRMTVKWDTGEEHWVGGPCEVITPIIFNHEKRNAIAELKAKQKI